MTVLYDNLNPYLLLDLPFREGVGTVTYDVSKYHRPITLVATPTWTTKTSGYPVLDFDAASDEYFECDDALTTELNFTTGDYSIGGWVNYSGGDNSMILARYELNVSGWELYFYGGILTLRHSHAAGATTRTAAYSLGWTVSTWWFFGVSRSGAAAVMYRNGVALPMVHSTGGLIDPETCSRDLVNCRFSKDDDYFNGPEKGLRIWGKSLSATDWLGIYNREKGWFG